MTSVSEYGVKFVATFEGFSAKPYKDAVGVWTIGFGETRGVGPHSPSLGRTQALAQLRRRLNRDYLPAVIKAHEAAGLHPNQNQIDAMTSLVYNLGPGVLERGRSLGDAIHSKDHHAIARAMLLYDKAAGKALPGLTRRRKAEHDLYLKAVKHDH